MKADLLLEDGEIVFPGEGVRRGSIAVVDGTIVAVLAPGTQVASVRRIDCRNQFVLPGFIDPHTHIGFGDGARDFATESRSAALGGVTSLLTFHRSNDLRESTGAWRAAGEGTSAVDFGFHFGVTNRVHLDTLAETAARFGVTSVKLYLMYKGAPGAARGFTEIDDGLLYRAMLRAAEVPRGVLSVHCENVEVIPVLREPLRAAGRSDLAAWDEQSPDFLEAENVFRVCYFGAKAECPVNIVHLSSAEGLEIVRAQRRPGRAPIHVETCAHYLSLTREAPAGHLAKVNPPLRSDRDVEALWDAVRSGEIETLGSDHVPRKRATKDPDLWGASAGFPGIGLLAPILVHEGVVRRGIPIERLAAATSSNVARLYSLANKGAIVPGYDADFVVIDPDREVVATAASQESFSDYTPYEGMRLRGAPVATVLRGRVIARDGRVADEPPAGRYLFRSPSASQG